MNLQNLKRSLSEPSPEYRSKQLHPVPKADVVDRVEFLLRRCK